MSQHYPIQFKRSGIDVLKERDTLGHALLEATAALAWGDNAESILRKVCDALVDSSPHIRLAWMILGNLSAEMLKPQYAIGPAKDYGYSLYFSPDQTKGPARLTIEHWKPFVGNITKDPIFCDVRERALRENLCSTVCLPIGRQYSENAGLVAIYADTAEYFDIIGLDLFNAFTNIVGISLEQTTLLNRLSYLANYDQLTNVINRRGLQEHLQSVLTHSQRYNKPFSIILFDLDRFKLINDSLGHNKGDQVLQYITIILKNALRTDDYFGRWGGEEFMCLLPDSDRDMANVIAERLRTKIAETPIFLDKTEVNVTASFGYACFPNDETNLDKLIAAADSALYQAKSAGRNRVISAQGVYQRIHSTGSMLESAIREARIIPAYQPIVDLASRNIVAQETLARLRTPEGNLLEAKSFINAASQLQLLHRIDYLIILEALNHCEATPGGEGKIFQFVNLSGDLLRHHDLVEELLLTARKKCTGEYYRKEKPIVIEITERELLGDIKNVRKLLSPFIDFGFRLALDDFGSGYSSYKYLVELPISILKIDGTLIKRLHEPKVEAIVKGIQDTAKQIGLITLAEFVEDAATAEKLIELGIDWGQGYFYGKPSLPPVDW